MNNNNRALSIMSGIILTLAILILLTILLGGQLRKQASPGAPTGPGGGGQINPPGQQAYVMPRATYTRQGLTLDPLAALRTA